MSECEHRWAIRISGPIFLNDSSTKSQEVFCLKCGKTVNDLLDEKDRQLDAAASDVAEVFGSQINSCDTCPRRGSGCNWSAGGVACAGEWRKRWEDEANGR